MITGCTKPDDFQEDSTIYIDPCRIELIYRIKSVKYVWVPNTKLPLGTKFYIYLDGQILSRDGKPNDEYAISKDIFLTASNFAVVPVTAAADAPDYDPLCGTVINRFTNINRDVILPSDQFTCAKREVTYNHFGKTRKNYVDPAWKVQVFNVKKGSLVRLKERRRLVGTEIITKPASPARPIMVVQDYRYDGQFDQQQYQLNPRHRPACKPYPANAGYIFITTESGVYPMSELELVKF
jgi:hypothetical protein